MGFSDANPRYVKSPIIAMNSFSREAAQRIARKIGKPRTDADVYKLMWAQAVLAGDELRAHKYWDKHRKVALERKISSTLRRDMESFRARVGEAEALSHAKESGIDGHPLKAGDLAPHFVLKNGWGKWVSLKGLLKKEPVVLSFFRGDWCHECNVELRALEEAWPTLSELGGSLIALYPQELHSSMSTEEKTRLPYQILSDQDNRVARKFGIVLTLPVSLYPLFASVGVQFPVLNGKDRFELPLPVTYVIDRHRKIRMSFTSADFTQRSDPGLIIALLLELATESRAA